jgi:hypothetical protein
LCAGDDAFVVVLVEGDDAGGAEVILRGLAGGAGEGFEVGGVGEECDGGVGHGFDVADREEEAVGVMLDEFGDSADTGGDGGDAAGHGFESGEAEGLHLRGHEHEVGEGEELVDVVLLAEEVDAVLDVEGSGEEFSGWAVGAVADEHEASGHGAGDSGEDFDDVGDALYGAEVGEVDEEFFVRGGVAGAHGGDEFGLADVDVAVDEVSDDFDLGGDVEGFAGAVAEVAGDAGHAVGLGDSETGDGEVGGVEADEGDVGSVEGGDDGEGASGGGELWPEHLGLDHLAGEDGADRVGDRVVNVEEIEGVELGDLGHAGGEGEVVGRVFEEGIVRGRDFVEVDVGFAAGEAEGLGVGDEVDVVATGGEFDAQLGGDDAGAAVGGVAGDADLAGRHAGSYLCIARGFSRSRCWAGSGRGGEVLRDYRGLHSG